MKQQTESDGLEGLRAQLQSTPVGQSTHDDGERRRAFFEGLRKAREEQGLSQTELAQLMGTRQSSVSEMESGRVDPKLRTLQRQARALGLRLDFTLVDPSMPLLDESRAKMIWERVESTTISPLLTRIATHPEDDRTLDALAGAVKFEPEIVRPILDSLVERGWVTSEPDSQGVTFALGERAAYVIGLSIERGRVVGALVNMHTKIVGECVTRGLTNTRRETVMSAATRLALDLYNARNGREVLGVGISVAGVVDEGTGAVRFAPDLRCDADSWIDVPLEEELQKRLRLRVGWDLRVAVDNDANSLAMREYLRDRPHSVMVILMSGAGIGQGLVKRGHLDYGARSAAGELGHIVVDYREDAPQCRAGLDHRGCLETLYGAGAIVNKLGLGSADLTELRASLAIANDRVERGDEEAIAVFEQAGENIGRAIAMAVRVSDPQNLSLYAHKELADPAYASARVFQAAFTRALEASGTFLDLAPGPAWHSMKVDTGAISAGAATMRHFLYDPPHWQPSVLAPRSRSGGIRLSIDEVDESREDAQYGVVDEVREEVPVSC